MAKFEKGQWVVAKPWNGWVEAGSIGKVAEDHAVPYVDWQNGRRLAVMEANLELWQPKVGERVRCIQGTAIVDEGKVYTVVAGKYATSGNNTFFVDTGWQNGAVDYNTDYFEPITAEAVAVAAPAQPTALKLEEGRYYVNRRGEKVGPMEDYGSAVWSGWSGNIGSRGYIFQRDGKHGDGDDYFGVRCIPNEMGMDLIAEWVDEPKDINDNTAAKPKFKVGDRVRSLVSWGSIKAGNVYVVPHIDPDGEVWFTPDGAGGWIYYLSDDELELVTTPPAIVALIENGVPKPATKPKVHDDQASATKEAERLALTHPGQQFGVFVLADSKVADLVNVPTAVLRAA